MDEAQVKALLDASLGALRTELTDQIHTANQGLAANLSKQIAKVIPTKQEKTVEPTEGSDNPLSMKALQTQIAELQKGLETERAAAFSSASDAALTQAVATSGTNNPAVLKKLLAADYSGKLKQEGSAWFIEDGEKAVPLQDAVKSYLQTDDGKFFLPPSGTKGSGATETKTGTASTSTPLTTEQAFSEAFAGV